MFRSLLLFLLLMVLPCSGATYYLATTGLDSNPGTEGSPFGDLYCLTNLQAGDTLYVRAGLYTGASNMITGIAGTPPNQFSIHLNSGTAASKVTVIGFPNEAPPIFSNPEAIDYVYTIFSLSGISNWTFSGLMFSNTCRSMLMSDCKWCTITNCIQTKMTATADYYAGINVWGASQFNLFTQNTFTNWGHTSAACAEKGTHLYLGNEADDSQTWYNLVESNRFGCGMHDNLQIDSGWNVVRGNYFHNEAWFPTNATCHKIALNGAENPLGAYGNRSMKPGDDGVVDARIVIENNIFAYSGPPPYDRGATFIELATSKAIVRGNWFMFSVAGGVYLSSALSTCKINTNCIYNNTFFDNGILDLYDYDSFQYDICLQNGNHTNNIFVNNLHFGAHRGAYDPSIAGTQTLRTNWLGALDATYPKFVNTNGYGDYSRTSNLPNLALQSDSPCIDAGTWLAYAVGNSNAATTLIVDNSKYFSDGNRIVTGDTIQLQGQTATSVVSSNDWERDTLYLATALTWTNGQGVALAYSGSAPDMGAFEYAGGGGGSVTYSGKRSGKTKQSGKVVWK